MADALNTGLSTKQRGEIVAGLNKVLADSSALYLKTHGYRWNVRGSDGPSPHVLLEGQYPEAWATLDTIAKPNRALGELIPPDTKRLQAHEKHAWRLRSTLGSR